MPVAAFILGAPNSPEGILSDIALGRVNAAQSLSRVVPSLRLIATGGFGRHFNTSPWPHRELVQVVLSERGVAFDPIASGALESGNTVEDLALIVDLLRGEGINSCFIVTSSFHVERCRLILDCMWPELLVVYVTAGDPTRLAASVYQHEQDAIEGIISAGGVTWADEWFPIVPRGP